MIGGTLLVQNNYNDAGRGGGERKGLTLVGENTGNGK
jgi:hypothetical protein